VILMSAGGRQLRRCERTPVNAHHAFTQELKQTCFCRMHTSYMLLHSHHRPVCRCVQ
jgi:hypothetical protein